MELAKKIGTPYGTMGNLPDKRKPRLFRRGTFPGSLLNDSYGAVEEKDWSTMINLRTKYLHQSP